MPERSGVRFLPTAAGAAALVLPLGAMLFRFPPADADLLLLIVGPPSLVVLSGLLVLISLGRLRAAASTGACAAAFPTEGVIGVPMPLTVGITVPGFLPGVRMSVHWILTFGPFRRHYAVSLDGSGLGRAAPVPDRRGEWQVRTILRASDPFGLVRLDCPCGPPRRLTVPPLARLLGGSESPGRPDARSASAPRLKEDAEFRLERRTYVPGDDPRRLDWKQYARSGDLLIRVGEDGLPIRGRIWILVTADAPRPTFFRHSMRRHVRHLDVLLSAALGLVRRFEADGADVRLLLPGESQWLPAGSDPDRRFAGVMACRPREDSFPAPGERLWILSLPGKAVLTTVSSASGRGCRSVLCYPSAEDSFGSRFGWSSLLTDRTELPALVTPLLYRYRFRRAVIDARRAGIDVRHV